MAAPPGPSGITTAGQSPAPHSPAVPSHGLHQARLTHQLTVLPSLGPSPAKRLMTTGAYGLPGSSHQCSALTCISLTVHLIACIMVWIPFCSCLRNYMCFKSF